MSNFFHIHSVSIIAWTNVHHTFAAETFFKREEFLIATQLAFHAHLMLHLNDAIPNRKLTLIWLKILPRAASVQYNMK